MNILVWLVFSFEKFAISVAKLKKKNNPFIINGKYSQTIILFS